jgi:hypothetical protein
MAPSISPKRPATRRGPQIIDHAAVQRYAQQTGEIMFAWNWLQQWLFFLFWTLIDVDNHTLAYGLWHTIQSDSNQREMLKAAAYAKLKNKRVLLRHIDWLLQKTTVLGTFRNDRAHAPMLFGDRLLPDFASTRGPVLKRLQFEHPEKQWRRVRDDLWGLGYFANSLAHEVWRPGEQPLPKRPRVLTKPVVLPPPPQQRRQRRRKK